MSSENTGGIATFRTARLILRGVTEADAPSYERHFVDWEVIGQLAAAVPWPYPAGGVRNFIADVILPAQGRDRWVWGLFRREEPDELIGVVDLWRTGRPENRGFWLGRPFWGRGYMTEAVIRITDHAFDDLGFDRLVFSNALGNERSRRVKERTGARLLCTQPAKFVNPAYSRQELWELTRADWAAWKARAQPGDGDH